LEQRCFTAYLTNHCPSHSSTSWRCS